MTVLRAQIRWESAISAEDDQMNTWHFVGQAAEADNAADMVEDFYTANGSVTSPLVNLWSTEILTGAYQIKVYDLSDPKPRAPIYERLGNASSAMGSGFGAPTQLCVVMSYEAEGISGVRQQRMRGRVYLGGWSRSFTEEAGLLNVDYQTRIVTAAEDLLAASDASINLSWCTFSPTIASGAPSIEDAAFPVASGWVDNSPDIQRRRKIDATARITWPA